MKIEKQNTMLVAGKTSGQKGLPSWREDFQVVHLLVANATIDPTSPCRQHVALHDW